MTLRRAGGWAAVALLLLSPFAITVGYRNYQAARNLVDREPPSPLLQNPGAAGLGMAESMAFSSHGELVEGWYMPPRNGAIIVVCTGTNSDRTSMLSEIQLLTAAGFGVIAFDWPGLGASAGTVRWGVEANDALSGATAWAQRRAGVDSVRIGGLGFSIGGYLLTRVAARDPRFLAIVLESTPSEFEEYVNVHYGKWGPLSRWPARLALQDTALLSSGSALDAIAAISPRPLLLIAQSRDPEIPISMVRKLEAAARSPKQLWVIDGDRHGSYSKAVGDEYGRRLVAFFRESLVR